MGRASVPDADVDCTFGQVSITPPFIDYGSNRGTPPPPSARSRSRKGR
ncbi:MAG TPA: hypothetical protein VKV57_15770 [bacterium]|nr:hypothetical protein [bacterium]